MTIRFAEEHELPALTALINQAFAVERFFKTGDRLDAEATGKLFRTGRFLIAEDKDGLAACIYIEMRGNRAYFGLLSVDPARQKSGLGRRLVSAAEEFAREMGAHFMDLRIVNLRRELPAIYEKFGYVLSGTEPLPEDLIAKVSRPCHFLLMTKSLSAK
jgi:GNAT superfamily N-acetyltransferase